MTDGGLETDLVYHHGVDLPGFAAFPLVDDDRGRERLLRYYAEYVDIARRAGTAVQLDTPTWRASADWGDRLGYSADELRRVNRDAVALIQRLRDDVRRRRRSLISGYLGPAATATSPATRSTPTTPPPTTRRRSRRSPSAGADLVTALTLTGTGEAIGIVRAARSAGLPVAVSFTVELDGRLPDGTPLAVGRRPMSTPPAAPDYFMVNCAHPTAHRAGLTDDGDWRRASVGLRANASTRSHAELDAATELDEGDPVELARGQTRCRHSSRTSTLVGGCCGTDARHVATMWAVA